MNLQDRLTSSRVFSIQISEQGTTQKTVLTLCELINQQDQFEYLYAIMDIIDDVLDLRLNESMYFQPNRDDASSKGIITLQAMNSSVL